MKSNLPIPPPPGKLWLSSFVENPDNPSEATNAAFALGRIQATTIAANAMYKRLWLVVGDFALLRKQVASRLVNLTTILADEFPEGHPDLADAFAGDKRDIRNSLGLLAEMDERIYAKKGMKA